jgi:hypothetical protein
VKNYPAFLISNIDEVCLSTIGTSGQKHFFFNLIQRAIKDSNNLEKSTLVISSCADGSHHPSVMLLSLQKVPQELYKFMSSDFYILPAPHKGWMTQRIFEWIS